MTSRMLPLESERAWQDIYLFYNQTNYDKLHVPLGIRQIMTSYMSLLESDKS